MPLPVVEIGGHGNDRLGDGFAQIRFGIALELLQDHGRNFLGRKCFVVDGHAHPRIPLWPSDDFVGNHALCFLGFRIVDATADKSFDRVNRVLGVDHRLSFGGLANQPFAAFVEGDDRRHGVCPFGRGDNDGGVAFHYRHDRVGRA